MLKMPYKNVAGANCAGFICILYGITSCLVRGEQFANAEHVEAITYTEPSMTLLKLLAGLTHEST